MGCDQPSQSLESQAGDRLGDRKIRLSLIRAEQENKAEHGDEAEAAKHEPELHNAK